MLPHIRAHATCQSHRQARITADVDHAFDGHGEAHALLGLLHAEAQLFGAHRNCHSLAGRSSALQNARELHATVDLHRAVWGATIPQCARDEVGFADEVRHKRAVGAFVDFGRRSHL